VKKTTINSIIFVTLLSIASTCFAKVITVDNDGPADYSRIQYAINAAVDGDVIIVADGSYGGNSNRDIIFPSAKFLTIRSKNGPENCIINCGGSQSNPHRAFYFSSVRNGEITIDGFTITAGYADYGGAIYSKYTNRSSTSKIHFLNCVFSNNQAKYNGGAVYFQSIGESAFINCVFENNTALTGGAVYSLSSGFVITGCSFYNNLAESGGGIYNSTSTSEIKVINSIFSNNTASLYGGGGINNYSVNTIIKNCLFSGNDTVDVGGGIRNNYGGNYIIYNCTFIDNHAAIGGGIQNHANAIPEIRNCVMWNNTDNTGNTESAQIQSDRYLPNVNYCCIEGWTGSLGGIDNIGDVPQFFDSNNGDFYLLPNSPCIDSGDPNYIAEPNETDLDGQLRIFGGRIDMGAYEADYVPTAMMITPQRLNVNSKGRWVKVQLVFGEGFLPGNVDVNEPLKILPLDIESSDINLFSDEMETTVLEIIFDRQAFCDALPDSDEIQITIIGSLTAGGYFYGTDVIDIIENPKK